MPKKLKKNSACGAETEGVTPVFGFPEDTEAAFEGSAKKGFKRRIKTLWKPTTKKQRIVLIVVLCVLGALIIAGGITAAVLLTKPQDTKTYAMPSRKIQYSYCIDASDTVGFYLDDAFRGEVPLSELTMTVKEESDNIHLTENLLVRMISATETNETAVYEFAYKGVTIAVVNIAARTVDEYVNTVEEFKSMSADKTYVLSADIDMAGQSGVAETFIGRLYGNHHKINNLDLSASGGLFKVCNGAVIESLNLVNVKGSIAATEAGAFGTIAGSVNNTSVQYCTVSGALSVTSTASEQVYLGGIVGYASNYARTSDTPTNVKAIAYNVSYMDIRLSGSGDLKIGGIAGGSLNATVRDSYNYGKISVEVANASSLTALYAGGMVGALAKEYNTDAMPVTSLDGANRLYCYAEININVQGGGDGVLCCVGGIYGSLVNHGLTNAKFGGKLDVSLTRSNLRLGGIVGYAENSTALTMQMRGLEVTAPIKIASIGEVYAGGLAGVTHSVGYDTVVGSTTPEIAANSEIQRTQIVGAAVAKNE